MTTLTPAATAPTTTIVGKAIYLEMTPIANSEGNFGWRGEKAIQQVIIFPTAPDSSGRSVAGSIWYREISPVTPRQQWSWDTIRPTKSMETLMAEADSELTYYRVPTIDKLDFDSYSPEVQAGLLNNGISLKLRNLMSNYDPIRDEETGKYSRVWRKGWEIAHTFSVELTTEDLDKLAARNTPQAVIRRINKSRVAKGLPEKLV